jgi:nucleosome binding factor SPN SPT16 subunit
MVIVFKDFHRPVQHINTIPMESIDAVKDWLDSQDLSYYEGNLNLQWGTIMKTVQEDPHEFFKTGGWKFLSTDDSEDEGEESEEESAFEEEDDFAEDESSEDESDFSAVADDDEEDAEMSDVSEAPSWDELERKAAKKDKGAADSDDDRGRGGNKRRKR